MTEHFLPRQRLDLWETVLCVLWIHCKNLFTAGRAQNFYDFDELVNATLSRENRLSKHELGDDATYRPDIYVRSIV